MSPMVRSLLNEWSPPITLDVVLSLISIVYLRGWLLLRRSSPGLIAASSLAAFLAGMFSLWVAIGSPLSAFDDASLTAHMIQHILLMLVVPPLVLLGAPALPLLHGFPQWFVRIVLGAFLRSRTVQAVGKSLVYPLVCWILAAVAMIAWHVPSAFELALRSDFWHDVEHLCFLSTSILFWWPVIQPFPSEARWPRWCIPVYLFLGMFPSSAVGAFLAFYDQVLYPSYREAPVLSLNSALADQVFAGSLMWVFGVFVCFLPAVLITLKLLSPQAVQASHSVPLSPEVPPKQFSSLGSPSQL
jgi:putative membrane protein